MKIEWMMVAVVASALIASTTQAQELSVEAAASPTWRVTPTAPAH